MAHLSGDAAFIEAFHQGGDIHRQTAALIFEFRPIRYPGDARPGQDDQLRHDLWPGCLCASRQLGISLEDARGFIARYFERFSGVRAFLDRQIELARQQGYVETLFSDAATYRR